MYALVGDGYALSVFNFVYNTQDETAEVVVRDAAALRSDVKDVYTVSIYVYLSYDIAIILRMTLCYKNHMNTCNNTLVCTVTSLTRMESTMHSHINVHFKRQ